MEKAPTEIIKRQEIHIAAIFGILPDTAAHKDRIVPFLGYRLAVPSSDAIQNLVLGMEKQPSVNLNTRIWSHTKKMAIGIALPPIEQAVQIIDTTNPNFPRIENSVAYLRCNRQLKVSVIQAETKGSAIDNFSSQIR